MGGKPKRPVYDFRMSLHYGLALGAADALFGVRVQNKLAWPPVQVDEDDTVERFVVSYPPDAKDAYEALNKAHGAEVAFGTDHASILTSMRSVVVDQKKLFGGDDGAGGVHGLLTWMPGKDDQNPPDFVDEKCGFEPGHGPGHRGYSSAFFTGAVKLEDIFDSVGNVIRTVGRIAAKKASGFLWSSNDPRQPSASFRVMRLPKAAPLSDWVSAQRFYLQPQHCLIAIPGEYDKPRRNDDDDLLPGGGGFPRANPVAFLYEIVSTNAYDGPADHAKMDVDSFLKAARIIAVEGLGVSVFYNSADGMEDLVTDLCEHIGATVFLHPVTGLYTIRLLRPESSWQIFKEPVIGAPNYKRPERTGFVMTPDNTSIAGEIKARVASELTSVLEVSYTIDETEESATLTLMSNRAIAASGGVRSDTRDFRFFRDQSAARTAGARELRNASTPAISMEVEFSRQAWSLAPFDIITANWPTEPALHGKEFIVAEIDYGTNANGERVIRAGLIEDIFSREDEGDGQISTLTQRSLGIPPGSQAPSVEGVYITPATPPMLIRSGESLDDIGDMAEDGVTRNSYLTHSRRPLTGANTMVWQNGQNPPSDGVMVESTPMARTRDALPAGQPVSTIDFGALNFGAQERDPEVGDLLIFVRAVSQDPASAAHWDSVTPANVVVSNAQRRYVQYDAVRSPCWAVGSAAMALDPDADAFATGAGAAPYYREEVTMITAIDYETGVVTIRRGIHDTVPVTIPAGSMVFHMDGGQDLTSPGDEIVGVSYKSSSLAVSGSGTAKRRVSNVIHTAMSRIGRPARPGNVSITSGGETATLGGKIALDEPADVLVQWATRNLLLDDADPRAWNAGSITPQDGARYYVRLWRRVRSKSVYTAKYPSPANLVKGWYNLTGTSLTIPLGDIVADLNDQTALNAASGTWKVPTDIVAGGSYAIEIGSHLGEATESDGAPGSVQNAILLLDVGLKAGGYGIDYGNDYGGAGPA